MYARSIEKSNRASVEHGADHEPCACAKYTNAKFPKADTPKDAAVLDLPSYKGRKFEDVDLEKISAG